MIHTPIAAPDQILNLNDESGVHTQHMTLQRTVLDAPRDVHTDYEDSSLARLAPARYMFRLAAILSAKRTLPADR